MSNEAVLKRDVAGVALTSNDILISNGGGREVMVVFFIS
jgi:hypothetical protein